MGFNCFGFLRCQDIVLKQQPKQLKSIYKIFKIKHSFGAMCKVCFIAKEENHNEQKNCSANTSHVMRIPWRCSICKELFCKDCVFDTLQTVVSKYSGSPNPRHYCKLCIEKELRGSLKSKL